MWNQAFCKISCIFILRQKFNAFNFSYSISERPKLYEIVWRLADLGLCTYTIYAFSINYDNGPIYGQWLLLLVCTKINFSNSLY